MALVKFITVLILIVVNSLIVADEGLAKNNNSIAKSNKVEIHDECQEDEVIKKTNPPSRMCVIKDLQAWLKANDFYQGRIDGVYGPETILAIMNFQKFNNLKADGIVGPETWRSIGNYPVIPTTKKTRQFSINNSSAKIYVDVTNKKLILHRENVPIKSYDVAVGKYYTPTPIGNWEITRKAMNWGTGFGSRWLGLNVNWGLFGIHGTNKPWSVGRAASHGCVRMANSQVEDLYEYVQSGNKVYIYGNPFGPLHKPIRVLMRGEKGTDVVEIQKQLKRLGYLHGTIDGIFGFTSEKAVKEMQKEMKVEVTAQIREVEYQRLGFGKIHEIRIRDNNVKEESN